MKLSEMKLILAGKDIRLTKALGQNFMHDGNQLRRIIALAELSASDKVLEIGPGLGPLTELLLATAGAVLAIETDRRLVDILRQRLGPQPALTLRHDDALAYIRQTPFDWTDWKLVANLPFSVASVILVEFALAPTCPERMVVTLQAEVAQRLMARADVKDYGVLTLLVQQRYEPRDWFPIPAGCFFPAPEVGSTCVRLVRRPVPLLRPDQRATFIQVVKQSFSQRRKMMRKLLKERWPIEKLEPAFAELQLPAGIRAEAVSLEQFIALTKMLHP